LEHPKWVGSGSECSSTPRLHSEHPKKLGDWLATRNGEFGAGTVAGKFFKIGRQWFSMFSPHLEYLRSSPEFCNMDIINNVSRNGEMVVAGSVFCRNPCRIIILNASVVVGNVFSHLDYLQNTPKCWNIGTKNNCSRNGDVARNVICRHAGWKIIRSLGWTACPSTNYIRHHQKLTNHRHQKQWPNKC